MPSVLRDLQAQWNALVPQAQARGIRRVNLLGGGDVSRAPLETIAYRRQKLTWLQALLGGTSLAGLDTLTFGVEIECLLPTGVNRAEAALRLTDAGVPCEAPMRLTHAVRPGYWKVVSDGSLGNPSRGAEFVSPVLQGEDGFRQLKTVCTALTTMGAKITKQCGFHVHIGVRNEPVNFFKNLVRLYVSAEPIIDSFMPRSRRSSANPYCQPVRFNEELLTEASTVNAVMVAAGQDPVRHASYGRYRKLNLSAYLRYETVEFRHHGGTCDAEKADKWVRFCMRMVLTARAGEKLVTSLEDLLEGFEDSDKAYWIGRQAYFNRNNARGE